MKALIDTKIIRFNQRTPKNETMKNLFYWLNKLKFEKVVHPDIVAELGVEHGYGVLEVVPPHEDFIGSLRIAGITVEEQVLDAMLFAVHCKIVNAFITEDGRTLANAKKLELSERVVSTN